MFAHSHEKIDHRKMRVEFWERRLSSTAEIPAELLKRLSIENPTPDWALKTLDGDQKTLRILDFNAGPVSAIGLNGGKVNVHLTAIDDLAVRFNELLDSKGVRPLLRTQFCSSQDVLATFGKNAFDLIYSYNGLQYTDDPVPIYRQLLQCLPTGGRIVTFHDLIEDSDQFERDRNRFFHGVKDDQVIIRRVSFFRNLGDSLPEADLEWSRNGDILRVDLVKRNDLRTPSNREPLQSNGREPAGLPNLVSMHLPKTGGSSFKEYLESLYGDGMLWLWEAHKTQPKVVRAMPLEPNIHCLHGHFQVNSFDSQRPDALKITWLRDPIERVVSSYFQYQRTPESAHDSAFNERLFKEGWSLMDFARSDEMRCHILWYFDALPLDEFFFIGITERYEESLRLFCHLLQKPMPETKLQSNVNPTKSVQERYTLSDAQRDELKSIYAEEYNLYRYAQYRLDHQLAAIK